MRLRDEARFALGELAERMGISQTAVVEQLVLAAARAEVNRPFQTDKQKSGRLLKPGEKRKLRSKADES